jgi:hypothetical protein
MAESRKFVAVRYIGHKPRKPDNVLHRKIEWVGHGDVQIVTLEDAMVYVRYKDVWAYAPEVELPDDGTPFMAPSEPPALNAEAQEAANTLQVDAVDVDSTRFTPEQMRERVQEVIRAIAKLKAGDFSANGKPKTQSLADILGRQVYAEERDAAWEQLSAVLRDDQLATTGAAASAA